MQSWSYCSSHARKRLNGRVKAVKLLGEFILGMEGDIEETYPPSDTEMEEVDSLDAFFSECSSCSKEDDDCDEALLTNYVC